jgi:hypothetical protein
VLGAQAAVEEGAGMPGVVGHGLAFVGVVALLVCSGFLGMEAAVSYSVLEEHAAELMSRSKEEA